VEWVSGQTPTAYFYDEEGNEQFHVEMTNMNLEEIEAFFISHNFPLRRH